MNKPLLKQERLPFEPTIKERKDFDIDCSKLPEHLHNIGAVNKTKKHLYDEGTELARKMAYNFTQEKLEIKEDKKLPTYGNCFIEFNNWNGPSGLVSTKAKIWVHRVHPIGILHTSIEFLRKLLLVDGKPSKHNALFKIQEELNYKHLIRIPNGSNTEGNSIGFVVSMSLLFSKEVLNKLLERKIEDTSFDFDLHEEWR